MNCDVIVIGSGPAGLSAAYTALKCGKQVILIEKMANPGMKLLASGGSRCNVSNILELEDFAARFGRQWRFLLPALSRFHGKKLLDFFNSAGVPLELTDGFHYFPRSGRSRDILDFFTNGITAAGGKILCGKKIVSISPGKSCRIQTADGEVFTASAVIFACGGRGYPALGGSMAGYTLAESLGHTVTPLYPAMTGIVCADKKVSECAGISLPACEAKIITTGRDKFSARGELLFTHHGFSAFAILDLAGTIARMLEKVPSVSLQLDMLPDLMENELQNRFNSWREQGGTKKISTLLGEFFPRKLALLLLNGNDPEISRWKKEDSAALLSKIKRGIWQITGVENWEKAMVTDGGIPLKEIDPETLASRIHPNIFFAGEMLDVTGPCGGFNITWALASGMLAGKSACGTSEIKNK